MSSRHYWEVEILAGLDPIQEVWLGVSRLGLEPVGLYAEASCMDAWFIGLVDGELVGNGKCGARNDDDDAPLFSDYGDRLGVLLDLDDGSLRFFKNGVQHGPGFPAGSVTGPVTHALQLNYFGEDFRLHSDAEWPAGHAR